MEGRGLTMLRMIVMNGHKAGSRCDLPEGKMHMVGRIGGVLPLEDRLASRVHAEFTSVNGNWCVNDMNSKNGTFLNGIRVDGQALVQAGDQLKIGKTTVLISLSQLEKKSKIGHLPMAPTPPRRKLGHILKSA